MSSVGRRLASPIRERHFTYDRYEALLERLSQVEHVEIVPLRKLMNGPSPGETLLGLRHDVDSRLDNALRMARIEHARGIQSTYFVLHTARYWRRPGLIRSLLVLQDDLGHEIGWHNDLVTLQCVLGVDARAFLARELERLRSAGIRVVGSASHGSPHCYRLGYHNNYFFEDFPRPVDGFPSVDVVNTRRGACTIQRASLADFDLEYEAYHLGYDRYFSDASFDHGRRWHPDDLEVRDLRRDEKVVILIHPDHWDVSAAAKFRRLPGHLARVALTRLSDRNAELGR